MLFAEEVARLLAKEVKRPLPEVMSLLEVPPDSKLGDIAFPCFFLAKEWKASPAKIALEVSMRLKPELPVDFVQAEGPYVNVFLDKSLVAEKVLTSKLSFPKRKIKVMIEHSNGNTHKEVHIGHLRNLFLGDALVRITRAAGFPVINAYYINDTGAHVAKCLWALRKFHEGEVPDDRRLKWLGAIYAEGARACKADVVAKAEADKVLQDLESGEQKTYALWKETRQWSLDDWHRIFEQLDMLPFDARFYDSEVVDDVKPIVDDLFEKGVLQESDGALIADLEEYGQHVVVVRKSDGTTPYIAKDLALAARKFGEYEIDRSIYVVASEQELHFRQLFKLLELQGFPQAKQCYHLSYGLVMLAEGKMSSREGTAILFDDFYASIFDHARSEVIKRHGEWSEKRVAEVAKAISLAAMKLPMVLQEPIKRIVFDIDAALDFEGETGPYVQYAYARLSSVLRKYGKKVSDRVSFSVLVAPEEQIVLRLLADEVDVVVKAAEKHRPSLVARFAIDLAQVVNSYYHAYPVLKEADEVRKARLLLVSRARDALARVLGLLGIPVLEEM